MKRIFCFIAMALASMGMCFAGVTTTSPAGGTTVGSPVHFIASATSPYAGIASMTVNIDSKNMYSIYAASLNTYITLAAGSHAVIMKAWDNKGNYFEQRFNVSVGSSSTTTTSTSTTSTSSTPTSSTGEVVTSAPTNGATLASPVKFSATSSSPVAPIGAMTLNIDSQNVYTVYSANLNTSVPLGSGVHYVVMKAWDTKGNYYEQRLNITVTSGSLAAATSGQTVISNIQAMGGWTSCSACAQPGGVGATAPNGFVQHVTNPSQDGNATQFWLGGSTPYTNALFTNHLGGQEGASNFILDFDFWAGNASYIQGLEMDIFYSRDGLKNFFNTECDAAGMYAGTWKFLNQQTDSWVPSGLPCKINSNAWNHVTLEFQRLSDGNTKFVSASMNGNVTYPNIVENAIPSSSFEMTPAIQLDGDYAQHNFSIYVDEMHVTYW